ncbi:hypothetical protein D3C74_287840 [compost metagenome]
MTARAPGYDPQDPSPAVLRMDAAENAYMNQGDGDSEERLHVILAAALDDPAVGAETRAALLGTPPPRCPDCGTLGGGHGLVHTRYGNGGGGNSPCPRTPAPVSDTRREDVAREAEVEREALRQFPDDPYVDDRDQVRLGFEAGAEWAFTRLAALPAPPVDEATVLERATEDMEAVIALGDSAETTAVPAGTTGVGSAIGARDALYEDPVAWLRDRVAHLRGATGG